MPREARVNLHRVDQAGRKLTKSGGQNTSEMLLVRFEVTGQPKKALQPRRDRDMSDVTIIILYASCGSEAAAV